MQHRQQRALTPLLWGALVGCAGDVGEDGPRRGGACRAGMEAQGAELSARITLEEEDVEAQILVPRGAGRYDDGTPAVVYVSGAWQTDTLPVEEQRLRLLPGYGTAQLYLSLPDDKRGAESRAHLAAALRYAAGWTSDAEGCDLPARIGGALSGQVVLAGFSNGGNLAWATLAWAEGELPAVAGITTFETPSAGQFVVAEPGTAENPSPLHSPGLCDIDAADALAIVCGYDYADIAFDEVARELFLDADGDGRLAEGAEFTLQRVTDPETGKRMHSLPARRAAAEAGLALGGRASVEETDAFWAVREAPRAMAAAVARHPALATIVVGTEVDHVLDGIEDHPHVTGMIDAAQRAGVPWSRLNPDAAYVTWAARVAVDAPELDANTPVGIDAQPPLLPAGGAVAADGDDYLTAAVLELLDRAHDAAWDADLDTVLWP